MGKYKNIRSVAHNFGHSFLSDMNLTAAEEHARLVPDLIYEAAKAGCTPVVRIDFIQKQVEPTSIDLPAIQAAIERYAAWLPELLRSQSIEPEMICEATLKLHFDFDHPRQSRFEEQRELPSVTCTVVLVDDRGTAHEAHPHNWCLE
jgi:hypothetical protein